MWCGCLYFTALLDYNAIDHDMIQDLRLKKSHMA